MDKRTLGGVGFAIGNAALIANGMIAYFKGNNPEARAAGLWRAGANAMFGVAAVGLAKYGERPVARQQARLEEKLAAFLQAQGVPLEAEALRKADAETRRGWFSKLEDFLYDHPMECLNIYTAVASGGMAVSGVLRRNEGNLQAGNANLGFSALTVAGTLASVLIPEKTPERLAAEGQSGLWAKMQEKPLASAKWLFMAADAHAGWEGRGEYLAARKLDAGDPYRPWQFGMSALSFAAMGAFLGGDLLTGAGSKKAAGTPEEHQAGQQALTQAAAALLAQEPPERREALTRQAADFLAHQPGLRLIDRTADGLAASIRQALPAPLDAVPVSHLRTR